MIFNKKLIALAVAFTCASSTFAASNWSFSIPGDLASVRTAAFNRGVAVTKWAADTGYGWYTSADNFSGQRLSKTGTWALGYIQSADQLLTSKTDGTKIGSGYAYVKTTITGLYTGVHDTIYPKSE